MMMRHSRFGALTLATLIVFGPGVVAQTRIAPPTAVESAPLAPPPGATPAQVTPPAPPAPVPAPEPQPVQPPPTLPGPVTPQPVQPPPTLPGPLEPRPVQPPPALPAPSGPLPQAPVAPPDRTQSVDPNTTLAGKPGDPSDVDPVLLVAKPVLKLAGQASWDMGFQKLTESFGILRAEAQKGGLPIAGRPLTLFIETDDNGFRFEAMLPVAPAPEGARKSEFANGVSAGLSPAGPSLRFVHTAPYDDIDSTYETITAYLEAKSISVKDAFLEEYVSELKDPGDPNLEINVYVQPR